MSSQPERVARNESTTREINEDIERAHQAASTPDHVRIVCECGRLECDRVIAITIAEYESVLALAAIAEELGWQAMLESGRELSRYTSPWYALALRLAADQAERATASRTADDLAEIRRRVAPVIAELERLVSSDVPQARHPWVRCNLLLAQAERSRLEGESDPKRWQTAAGAWEGLERLSRPVPGHRRHQPRSGWTRLSGPDRPAPSAPRVSGGFLPVPLPARPGLGRACGAGGWATRSSDQRPG